jgi:hypothetical protein
MPFARAGLIRAFGGLQKNRSDVAWQASAKASSALNASGVRAPEQLIAAERIQDECHPSARMPLAIFPAR